MIQKKIPTLNEHSVTTDDVDDEKSSFIKNFARQVIRVPSKNRRLHILSVKQLRTHEIFFIKY